MKMPQQRRILVCLTVLLGCCAQLELMFAQNPGATQARIVTPPRLGAPNVFTVMGHVGDQRAFELATASPSLVELVEVFARGLTDTASYNVRIVRNGRVINTLYYRKDSPERLMPGDLVIVDGKSTHGTIIRGGRSDSVSPDGIVRVGVLGALPYPVILEFGVGQVATLASIATGHLNQPEGAMLRAQVIAPRRFGQMDVTAQLPDCSVIVFEPSTIDRWRLPTNLRPPHRPRESGGPTEQHDAADPRQLRPYSGEPPRPLSQVPFARNLTAPGIAAVPANSHPGLMPPKTLPSAPSGGPARNDQPLQRDAEERVRDLLTSPSSVAIESSQAPRQSDQATDQQEPGRVSLGDQVKTNAATTEEPANASRGRLGRPSPVATKPFQSFTDTSAAKGAASADAGPVELPLAPANEPEKGTSATSDSSVARERSGFADTSLGGSGPSVSYRSGAVSSSDSSMPFPTPVAESGQDAAVPQHAESGNAAATLSATTSESSRHPDAVLKGSVAPKPFRPANWPLVSALTIGGIVVVSILLMMIVVAWRRPDLPAAVDPGQRFWLERIIQNELPIEDEPVSLPNGEQLFGQATPILRVDAAHSSVPKPHFLAAGGASGIRRGSAPPSADPESGESDSPMTGTRETPETRTPRHDDRPSRSQPMVPLRPAAEHSATVETGTGVSSGIALDLARMPSSVVASRETEPRHKPGRRAFRVDSGHQPVPRSRVSSASVSKSFDVDATLAEVPASAEPGTQVSNPEERQTDIRQNDRAARTGSGPRVVADGAETSVPRPRFLRRRSVVATEVQPAAGAQAVADGQTIASSQPAFEEKPPTRRQVEKSVLTNASAAEPQAEISIKPARSVAETADLLDRVLSSVHQEKRGNQ